MNIDFDDDYLEQHALVEATELTPEQYTLFLLELQKIPSPRSPITGKAAVLAFEFMEDTGCRITETLHVRKKDIDFRTRILTVIHPKTSKECKCSRWKYKDQYTRHRVLDYADPNCKLCHGLGRWKKPQHTTITPRIYAKLQAYVSNLNDEDLLWPVSRVSMWKWGKKAGVKAGINIFQQKEERKVEGIFLHLFRALCSLRMTRDASNDKYKDALVACKMRHSFKLMTDRYTKITVNYLVGWESRTYQNA